MRSIILILLSISFIFTFSCKKGNNNITTDTTTTTTIEETTETTIEENIDTRASDYYTTLYEFIYSDAMRAVTKSNFVENGGAAGSSKSEFPGGSSESVSGLTMIQITNDNAFINYGYTGALYIGKDKNDVIKDLGDEYQDENNRLTYNRSSLTFEYDSNNIVKTIYISPMY